MRQLWKLVRADIPGLGVDYTEKTQHDFFKQWQKYYQVNKTKGNVKSKTCAVLPKIVSSLAGKEKTSKAFIDLYGGLMKDWKNKALMSDADAFVRSCLEKEQVPAVKKSLVAMGRDMASISGERKDIEFYAALEAAAIQ